MKKGRNNLAKEKGINKKNKVDTTNGSQIKRIDINRVQRIQRERNKNRKELKPSEFPESIVEVILNKIISYVIYQTTVKEVYTHMDEKCFNYLKYIITPYLSTEYMFYEDGIEDINLQKKKFYYKVPVRKRVNTWANIQEPDAPEIDRYSSYTTKIIPCKTDNNDNSNKDIIALNFGNKDAESKDMKNIRRKSTVIDDKLIVNESEEYTKRTKSIRMASIRNVSSKKIKKINEMNMDIKEKIKNELLEKKNKRLQEKLKKEEEEKILEFTWVDLPKERYENKYIMKNNNEENNILRKERENIIIKQTELKALKEIQDKKEKLKRFQNRLQKNFDGSRQTFDPNGNIINIRPPQVENLNNEFCFIKIPNIELKNTQRERRSSISLVKNQNLTRRNSLVDKSKNSALIKNPFKKLNTLKYKGPMSEEAKEIIKYVKNALLPKWQHRPVKKDFFEDDEGEESEEKEHKKFVANKPFRDFFHPFIKDYIFKEEVERNPIDRINNVGYYKYDNPKKKIILPSGPNFKKIKPEIGVVIENKNIEKRKVIKDGGFEFIKKYNKPSMYEFSKLLMETSQLNSSKVLSSGLIESKVNEISEINNINRNNEANKEEYNYNGYMVEFSDMNNPLFQGAFSINDKNRISSSKSQINNMAIMKGRNALNSMDDKYLKNKYNSMNLINMQNNSIQLTKNVKAPNLYSYFHEVLKEPEKNLESNEEEEYEIDSNKDFNTLQKEKNKDRNSALPVLRLRKNEIDRFNMNAIKNQMKGRKIINKFNYKIVKNKKWGEEDEKKKKEREMMNFGLDSGSNNNNINNQNEDNRNQLKQVAKNIISVQDGKYNIRNRRNLFRSASAGNIF